MRTSRETKEEEETSCNVESVLFPWLFLETDGLYACPDDESFSNQLLNMLVNEQLQSNESYRDRDYNDDTT